MTLIRWQRPIVCSALLGAVVFLLPDQGRAQELPSLPPVVIQGQRPTAPAPPPQPPPPPEPAPPTPPAISIQDSRSSPASNAIGSSPSASEGSINQLDLANQPLLRPASVLEYIPGLIAEDQTATVKANVYLLRGFFLDHGTDISAWIDDVPYNEVNHVHLHGYLDLNSLIPELVQTVDFQKGVYYPNAGDFSSAVSVRMTLMDSLPYGIFKSEFGKDSYFRELIANSDQLGQGTLLYAFDAKYFNGPWEYPENSRQFKGILRYTMGDDSDGLRVTASGYTGVGRTNDAIPLVAIEDGLNNRYGTSDPFEGVSTQRFQLNSQWWHKNEEGDLTKANVYGVYYTFSYFFDETGDFEDPLNGDLVHEFEHNMTFGGSLEQSWDSRLFGDSVRNTVGLQVRNDNMPDIGDQHVVNRNLLNVLDEASVIESNVGEYYNSDVKWGEKVRTELGLRVDYFHWHVDDFVLPVNDGHTESKLLEPKGSLILGPWDETVFYLNGGYGFHTNDARGIFATESAPLVPISQGGTITPTTPASPIARTRGAEVGMKTQAIPNLTTTFALWYLRLASELVYDPDDRTADPRGPSERYGIELSNTYRLNGWLTFDLDWSASQAHFLSIDQADNGSPTGDGAGGTEVPQAVGVIVTAGPTVRLPSGYFASLRYRYIGPRDLSSDGLISSHATNDFDLGMGYECLRYTVGMNILNLFNSNGVDDAFEGEGGFGGPNGPKYTNTEIIHPLQPFQARFYFNLKW